MRHEKVSTDFSFPIETKLSHSCLCCVTQPIIICDGYWREFTLSIRKNTSSLHCSLFFHRSFSEITHCAVFVCTVSEMIRHSKPAFSALWLVNRGMWQPTGEQSAAVIIQKLLPANQQPWAGLCQSQQERRWGITPSIVKPKHFTTCTGGTLQCRSIPETPSWMTTELIGAMVHAVVLCSVQGFNSVFRI